MNNFSRKHLRILAADDSAVMRGVLRRLFLEHSEDGSKALPSMELCGVAQDGVECLEALARLQPDVLLLDMEMPHLNGLGVLEHLRAGMSTVPVIMCSAHTEAGARLTLDALALGAMDYVTKPTGQGDPKVALRTLAEQLLPRIAAVSQAGRPASVTSNFGDRAQRQAKQAGSEGTVEAVVIGVSTGGPTALERILPNLPQDLPVPVLIAQHMPKLFTQALADRLDRCCKIRVAQAYQGALLTPGTIWLAPGGIDMLVTQGSRGELVSGRSGPPRIQLQQQNSLKHCTPSVDALFQSAASVFGRGTLAYVLTGMGEDGLLGAHDIYQSGGTVVAQDEQSSAVWGMPARVIHAGIAGAVLPLSGIAADLIRRVSPSLSVSVPAQYSFGSSNAVEVPYAM